MKRIWILIIALVVLLLVIIHVSTLEDDSAHLEVPQSITWKHYKENLHMNIEFDYPATDIPSPDISAGPSKDDIDSYSVRFGDHFEVYSSATNEKNIDDFTRKVDRNVTNIVKKITIDGYDAVVLKDADTFDLSKPQPYTITFIAHGRMYSFWFRDELYNQHILNTVNILK